MTLSVDKFNQLIIQILLTLDLRNNINLLLTSQQILANLSKRLALSITLVIIQEVSQVKVSPITIRLTLSSTLPMMP